jgi:peptide chain release factor 1
MDPNVEARLDEIESAFAETEAMLSDPDVYADLPRLADLGRRNAELRDVVADIRRWREASADLDEAEDMSDDPDMARLVAELSEEIEALEERIRAALVPADPNDDKDVIVEDV